MESVESIESIESMESMEAESSDLDDLENFGALELREDLRTSAWLSATPMQAEATPVHEEVQKQVDATGSNFNESGAFCSGAFCLFMFD